ncbi:MAG TPA: ATPase domain-containing protein [Candidatus Limnocylindria bacterium]|nr:ATPase domain-containing protein [Candidatus Limnocylindria bacterium]
MKRLNTGIPRLDSILGGGLPFGSLIVIAGSPGTGKTILAQQICFTNGTQERKAIYYSTISEPPEKFLTHLEVFDFFDRRALEVRVEFINLGDLLLSNEDGLSAMMDEVVRKVVTENPAIVVIDSAKALRDFSGDGRSLRAAVYQLVTRVAHTDTTLIFVGEYTADELGSAPEFSLADGILELVYESHEPTDRRWLRVRKLRSSKHLTGKHPLQIGAGGIKLFVRAETLDEHSKSRAEVEGRISTGVPGLDEMTHGGLPAGGSTLVLGPSGCGKTALALRFIMQGLENGERGLYVTFQETPTQLVRKAASFGWDLKPAIASGQLKIFHVEEVSLDLDYIAGIVREELERAPLQRMVIDSLAEMVVAARESERFSAYARSLLGSLRAGGVSVLTTSETSSLGPTTELIGGLSFLYHNVVLLRYIEQDSEVGRAVAIVKMRDSNHEKGLWAFTITERGFEVLGKVEGVSGLLGWSALRGPKTDES